jgi:tRNA (Thr-GGU) A37 N-methylase
MTYSDSTHSFQKNLLPASKTCVEVDMHLKPIGIIQTPFEDREGMPIQPTGAKDIKGKIIISTEYEQGLSNIAGKCALFLPYFVRFSPCRFHSQTVRSSLRQPEYSVGSPR